MQANPVLDAIEAAAQAGDPAICFPGRRHTSSRRREAETRQLVLRFLQNVPEEMTAMEMRRAIEEAG